MNKYDNAFLMGDFNLDGYAETKKLDPGFQDIWRMLQPNDMGISRPNYGEFLSRRLDRILAKKNNFIDLTSIELIGTDNIPKYEGKDPLKDKIQDEDGFGYIVFTPSDHFGLRAEVKLSANHE